MAAAALRKATSQCLVFKNAPRIFTKVYSSSSNVGGEVDPMKGKIASDKVTMPDNLGHSVGPERFELLSKMAGNEDPFEMNVKTRAKGTKDEPTLIPSMYDRRLIGCVCDDDTLSIMWMMLHRGEAKRCQCGFWFKLVDVDLSKHVMP